MRNNSPLGPVSTGIQQIQTVMEKQLSYDEAVARIEALTKEMASFGAVGMEEYKQKASEAQRLIDYCRKQLTDFEKEVSETLNP